MRENNIRKTIKLACTGISLWVFIAGALISLGMTNHLLGCVVLFCALFAAFATYYMNILAGSALMTLTLIGWAAYAGAHDTFNAVEYCVGIVWMVTLIVAANHIKRHLDIMLAEYSLLKSQSKYTQLLDQATELKNLRAYQNDADIYIRIATRHGLQLALILWRLEDCAAMRDKLGTERYGELRIDISRMLRDTVRIEDIVYMVDERTCTWGTLHITDTRQIDKIKARILAKFEQYNKPGNLSGGEAVRISVGSAVYNEDDKLSPLGMLDEALQGVRTSSNPVA